MAYQIPLFNLNFDECEAKAAYDTIRSGWISTGPKCAELEEMFAKMLGAKYAVSVTNCTDALHLCCMLCGFGPGDEVICPSLTFAASANCIRYVGATPVFADIVGPEHINIDPADIEKKITSKTKGIVVVHMAGYPAKMDEIISIAKKYNLKVVEDACHAPLSEYKRKKIGTIGDCSAFSFFSNKNISTGEGGMFVTNSEELASKARLIRSHGMTTMSYQRASGHATEYDIVELGYNFRLDDIRASIAIEQLKKLPGDLEKRIEVRKRYIANLVDDLEKSVLSKSSLPRIGYPKISLPILSSSFSRNPKKL
ncbi:DegT/DnrJ/EryC1/StrS aminotransferase family protein [uncultured Treponema sp.]|uniref:DegT/DnrJ/EryC1/StrS family aminotransferase n=1 Tax=uncultured Treponema sp. TaxID=162155 RepID=UPI0025E73685|nr:DegT/DnrJ/EryC1/StrS family aminotransferase [uncultured Treponema sp.]